MLLAGGTVVTMDPHRRVLDQGPPDQSLEGPVDLQQVRDQLLGRPLLARGLQRQCTWPCGAMAGWTQTRAAS